MKLATPITLALVIVVVCPTSSTATEPSEKFRCTHALEGKLVGAASGVVLGVPFRGRILLDTEDGSLSSSTVGWFANAEDPCPWLRGREVALSSDGEFDEAYALPFDTHSFCRNGDLEEETTVAPAHLLVSAPGCEPVELWLNQDDKFHNLTLLCSTELMREHQTIDSLRHVHDGAIVELRDHRLFVNGHAISMPAKLKFLLASLGDPSDVVMAAGDKYSDDVWEWERSGIYAYARPGRKRVHALAVVLAPLANGRHWCSPGVATLKVNGVEVSKNTLSADLVAAGFEFGDDGWEQDHHGVYFALDESPGDSGPEFRELEVGTK